MMMTMKKEMAWKRDKRWNGVILDDHILQRTLLELTAFSIYAQQYRLKSLVAKRENQKINTTDF